MKKLRLAILPVKRCDHTIQNPRGWNHDYRFLSKRLCGTHAWQPYKLIIAILVPVMLHESLITAWSKLKAWVSPKQDHIEAQATWPAMPLVRPTDAPHPPRGWLWLVFHDETPRSINQVRAMLRQNSPPLNLPSKPQVVDVLAQNPPKAVRDWFGDAGVLPTWTFAGSSDEVLVCQYRTGDGWTWRPLSSAQQLPAEGFRIFVPLPAGKH